MIYKDNNNFKKSLEILKESEDIFNYSFGVLPYQKLK